MVGNDGAKVKNWVSDLCSVHCRGTHRRASSAQLYLHRAWWHLQVADHCSSSILACQYCNLTKKTLLISFVLSFHKPSIPYIPGQAPGIIDALITHGWDWAYESGWQFSTDHRLSRYSRFEIFVTVSSASHARGPRFESWWEHSSFSLKSPDFVPVAPRVAFSGMGQARIENNLFNLFICTHYILMRPKLPDYSAVRKVRQTLRHY